MAWQLEQVLALAPDPASAKSGKDLGSARKWKTLGASDVCVWGTIQGSGKNPYQTSIDLNGPAFKCTCPSRKFPCKHGLGLFLIFVQQAAAFTEKDIPGWASEWLEKRTTKEEKKVETKPRNDDPEAIAKAEAAAEKRLAARESKVSQGLEELSVWMEDLVRTGFTALPAKPSSFWQMPASRLVDAQAPGLARRVGSLAGITTVGQHWPELMLRRLAQLQLARKGWEQLAKLPAETQADLRGAIGVNVSQEDLLKEPAVLDNWQVIAQLIEEDDRLRVQRIWLFGQNSKRFALILTFSAGPAQPFDISLVPGTTHQAELVFYPGSFPLRALVKQKIAAPEQSPFNAPHQTIAEANGFAAEGLIRNPWVDRVPMALAVVTPIKKEDQWILQDTQGAVLPMQVSDNRGWALRAISGGKPIQIMGEWNGENFFPLTVWEKERMISIWLLPI